MIKTHFQSPWWNLPLASSMMVTSAAIGLTTQNWSVACSDRESKKSIEKYYNNIPAYRSVGTLQNTPCCEDNTYLLDNCD